MQDRTHRRAHTLVLSSLVALGRRTITGLLSTAGQQFEDWSAAYRLFSRARFDVAELFSVARQAVLERLPPERPFVALMDDTVLRKRGRKVAGTSWHRDPLGPHFCNNFIWAQRFLQVAAALPEGPGPSRARAVPLDMVHCPSPRKPRKKAPEEEWKQYRQRCSESRISTRGVECIARLREQLDQDGQEQRPLIVSVDGTYTNATVLRNLAARTTLIGRIRKDARLFAKPAASTGRGRKRYYGEPLPTPEQYRQDDTLPWQQTEAALSGQMVTIEYKIVGPVRWRAGGQRDLLLVMLRPFAYRTAKGRHLQYREPIYLLCTDTELDIAQLVQAYLWRWEIEVGFRDQKTLLGSGEAQVRTVDAVSRVPAFIAVAYSYLQLALADFGDGNPKSDLPRPRWYPARQNQRLSTQQGINLVRAELWGQALGLENKTDFVAIQHQMPMPSKMPSNPASAILYVNR